MSDAHSLVADTEGSAAVEMALVTPLLLVLMMGCFELGNYFMEEHLVVKAVRDGARYAARQDFQNFQTCSGEPGGTVAADTRRLVKQGLLAGGSDQLPNWNDSTITVTTSCTASSSLQPIEGIYFGRATGAPLVTVSVSVPYTPVLAKFGFTGLGYSLNARQHAAVMGI